MHYVQAGWPVGSCQLAEWPTTPSPWTFSQSHFLVNGVDTKCNVLVKRQIFGDGRLLKGSKTFCTTEGSFQLGLTNREGYLDAHRSALFFFGSMLINHEADGYQGWTNKIGLKFLFHEIKWNQHSRLFRRL